METMISDKETEHMKLLLLDMLSWFHDFCERNHLRYYAQGGTMLGAARHGGFIPWDDDIDVGMPRKDYIRFQKLMKDMPSERYILETPDSENPDYFYPITKLYDARTTLVENTRYQIKRGIYIDIFPLDGAGNTREEAMAFFRGIKRRRQLLLTLTTGIRKGRSLYKNLSVMVMRCIPDWLLRKKKLLLSLDKLGASRDFDACSWIGNLFGNWMEREVMPRSIYGEPKAYRFENLTIWGPTDHDAYLSAMYGNWRQLPPEEKRKSHHDFVVIDLDASYLA